MKLIRSLSLALALAAPVALSFTFPATAVAQTAVATAQPLKKTLPNGLTVIVQENHAAPVAAVRFYVRTGSIYEGQYLGSGISHLFEHALSEGTTTRTKDQINDVVQGIGGQSNAYTSYDVTAYHITTASAYLEKALDSLADEMRNATFPEAEVETQKGVIHNEMNLGEDDPDRILSQLFYRTAFRVHPVRYPIIGYRENFDRLTQRDIIEYYRTHYTPENVVLSIAGDVNAQTVFRLAAQKLGDWQRRSPATPALPTEPRQNSPRRAVVEKDINQSYLQMGWHTIPLQHPDLYALDVLAQVMGGGESSRLVRSLRERQDLVTGISAYSSTPNYDAGVFAVRATLQPGKERQVENAVWTEIGKVWNNGISPAELARAKKQIETAFVFNNSSVEDQAEQNAYDELNTGDPGYSRRYVARIQSVTAAQVQQMAKQYLLREGVTTALVVPRRAPVATKSTVEKKATAGAPTLIRLPNGMRLIVRENHATPTVSIVAMGMGGARLEPTAKTGISAVFAEMLTRGTQKRSAEQIASLVDEMGGSLEGFAGYNAWGVQSQWLSRDWRRGLSLVGESILAPTFPESELERVKSQQLARIKSQQDDPMGAASLLLRRTFFGNHPYGRPALGTQLTVPKIEQADLKELYNRTVLPNSMVISIYGDINTADVQRAAADMFKNFNKSGKVTIAPVAPAPLTQFTEVAKGKTGAAQTVLFYGFPGIDVKNKDRYAIDVLDAALSGANLPGGRLHARLRDNQLVYVVHAFDQPGVDPGMFVIYAATTGANRDKVKSIIAEELAKAREADFTPEELERAKTMVISSEAIESQTNGAQASQAASDELFGLGYRNAASLESRINAVSLEDVRRAAQKYLRPEAAALAVIEPEAK
ncbi:MAG TPA: pitrilysin family protein [Abditibacteriaceae bacterium]|jgi:zinc protease